MSADARTKILDACERVIAKAGLAKFRMSAVAKEAGVSIGLLAYHFGDRDGLLQAALDHVNDGTTSRAAIHGSGASAAERLEALMFSEFGNEPGVREGSIVWNEMRAAAVFDADRARAIASSTEEWEAIVRELLTEVQAANPSREHAPDVAVTALALTSLVEGLSGRWLSGQITASEAQRTLRETVRHFM